MLRSFQAGDSVTVTMKDTLESLFLGILSTILLQAEARNRILSSELAKSHGFILTDTQ